MRRAIIFRLALVLVLTLALYPQPYLQHSPSHVHVSRLFLLYTVDIAKDLEGSFIVNALLRIELSDFCRLKQLGKNLFLQRGRTFHKTRKVLDGIEPLVEQRIQLLLLLGKLGHFEINIRQFIVEHFLCLSVKQLDFMMKVIGIGIIETKV